MTTWQWQTLDGSSYLTCSLLSDWQHGFMTRHFAPLEPSEITQLLQPMATGYRLKQVHGNVVLTPTEAANTPEKELATGWAQADGLISEAPDQGVWVASADCNPVLIADRHSGQVAAVHAGWRGTAQQIVPVAIQRFLDAGSSVTQLLVAIGPAIDGQVYQVTNQTAAEVCLSILPELVGAEPDSIVAKALKLPNSPLLTDEQPGRVRLDVRQVNAIQLQQIGLSADQISIAPHCTFQEPEQFFSYRREKLKRVQWSGIISRQLIKHEPLSTGHYR
jgi:polyphenol oxidase